MKFGHHGTNHPILDLTSKRVMISSQNHGFAVRKDTLPSELCITHYSLFDGSIQGIKKIGDGNAIGFQGHPEASPGPLDMDYLFQEFFKIIQKNLAAESMNAHFKKVITG
jgi:carbamoyl-phosphate synthase small subunit